MGKTVVCGIPRAESARGTSSVAAQLATALRADLELVHVHEAEGLFSRLAGPRERRPMRRRLAVLVDRNDLAPGTRIRLVAGDPAQELTRVAEEDDAALIVIGSRGRLELGRAVLGSVGMSLVMSAPCPVAVLPPDVPPLDASQLHSVVCGVEGSDRDRDLLRLGADLVRRLGGDLHAVHAIDLGPATGPAAHPSPDPQELREAAEDMLARTLESAGVSAHAHVVTPPIAQALERCAERQGAGLLLVGSQGLGRVGSVVLGSVSIRLAAKARRPVVVLPPNAEVTPRSGHYEVAPMSPRRDDERPRRR
jgi:nucleotide-binding universal stress UspA family protein